MKTLWKNLSYRILKLSKIKLEVFLNFMSKKIIKSQKKIAQWHDFPPFLVRLARLFFLSRPDVALSLPCWLSQFSWDSWFRSCKVTYKRDQYMISGRNKIKMHLSAESFSAQRVWRSKLRIYQKKSLPLTFFIIKVSPIPNSCFQNFLIAPQHQ